MDYQSFLDRKRIELKPVGFEPDGARFPREMFDWQRDIVSWAVRRGRAALFEDCGLGKTLQQLAWAEQVHRHTGGNVIILAPLAVARQTADEAARFGIEAHVSRDGTIYPITVTNYELLHKFDTSQFTGVVLDESSIIKAYDGKTKAQIIEAFARTPYRLACTATPAPNDHMELGNHAEFLGVMTRAEMLAMFFIHDGGDTSKWRLKGHAQSEFWKWVASWAVMIRKPSDIGYPDDRFVLPAIHRHQVSVSVDHQEGAADGAQLYLFNVEAKTLTERRNAKKVSIVDRVAACAELANNSSDPWIVWCNLNSESEALCKAIPDAVEITGSDAAEVKEQRMMDFAAGKIRVLVTKPTIAGFGMNWQHCAHMAFVGLSDSYEQVYQAERRSYRFGQQRDVHVYVITSELEGAVVRNIERKTADADAMAAGMLEHMKEVMSVNTQTDRDTTAYEPDIAQGEGWAVHLGDCVEMMRSLPDDSIDYSIFSPPFSSLYTYSNSDRDMGNCANDEEFYAHYQFLVAEQFRTLKPGRLLSFHCMNLPTTKSRDGYIGIRDFRGDLIRLYQAAGFIFHSEVCIWKDPVTAMQRTKALGLLYKQLKKDSAMSRQGIPDYLVTMRKPGENTAPVTKDSNDFSVDLWQQYASPVWMDVNPSRTLQYMSARDEEDEKHICPLQLDVIERGIELWSNPGDLVCSPFTGIGSEGYTALKMGRRFVGAELKPSYWRVAVKNLQTAEVESATPSLFDLAS